MIRKFNFQHIKKWKIESEKVDFGKESDMLSKT